MKMSKTIKDIMNLDVLFGKWIVLLLLTIYHYGAINFYQLNKATAKITPKVLSSKLKVLEQMGLIGKNILLEQPLRVEYYIKKKGKGFIENIQNTFNLEPFLPNNN